MPLIATVTGVPSEHAAKQPDGEGMIERKGMSKGHMIESAAVGAGVGAIAGGAIKGGKGAGIGAGAGAGMGALTGFLTDRNLRLQKGTTLEVRLDHPLQIPQR
jgi:outer membrane lipoprotein SlyB